jgi:quercetin dioxygenase-like cupin family protein
MRPHETKFSRTVRGITLLGGAAVRGAASTAVVSQPPQMILNAVTQDLPKTPSARVRVFVGTLAPRDVTFWHLHDSPPIVYVEHGTGTWEFKGGRPSETRHAGQAIVEPAHVAVRLANHGTTTVSVVMVTATEPDEPFMRPASQH